MLENLIAALKKKWPRTAAWATEHHDASLRKRAIQHSASAGLAAKLLVSHESLMRLTPNEAMTVVSYMAPHRIAAGTVFIEEGDTRETDYMVLILEGEVMVESTVGNRREPITVSVLGPGHMVGEMGLIDGHARLASCTATTDVQGAVLTREALEKLVEQHPRTAAKLMFAVSLHIAERLRDTTEKLKMYTQLTQVMQEELK